jgi:hypothetical protein
VANARVEIDRGRVSMTRMTRSAYRQARLMVITGLGFELALVRAGVLPFWAEAAPMAGAVTFALTQTTPEGVQLNTEAWQNGW